jgi:hypothetical protein
MDTNISEKPAGFAFRLDETLIPGEFTFRFDETLIPIRLHDVTTNKAVISHFLHIKIFRN